MYLSKVGTVATLAILSFCLVFQVTASGLYHHTSYIDGGDGIGDAENRARFQQRLNAIKQAQYYQQQATSQPVERARPRVGGGGVGRTHHRTQSRVGGGRVETARSGRQTATGTIDTSSHNYAVARRFFEHDE